MLCCASLLVLLEAVLQGSGPPEWEQWAWEVWVQVVLYWRPNQLHHQHLQHQLLLMLCCTHQQRQAPWG
jgi:hypothetical protein